MGILAFIILGLVSGALIKVLMPGLVSGGWPTSLALGVLGALLGGWLGSALLGAGLGTFFEPQTWLLAVIGAGVLVLAYGAVKGHPPTTRR
ncbi:GlsB/YeaQ/YmgE family stress response membrane protein [Pseudarthrobacter sp. AB1]|uniref:GlsB/YeaQ/YmgE family stress response membrane protein n=1 Tax=Pseudarthrobacter sp. AB1 TaxID=2138309 RepID=UPI00186B6802|nr:GlsB/YeaQ/YmgE family stress response membrane protein [Pseudarthrobacter sp. AB1]MBE4720309.1 GlsB/YeaQ/YmgE family stress response membrane protein [Pseudarthrobacter sp. AB1]